MIADVIMWRTFHVVGSRTAILNMIVDKTFAFYIAITYEKYNNESITRRNMQFYFVTSGFKYYESNQILLCCCLTFTMALWQGKGKFKIWIKHIFIRVSVHQWNRPQHPSTSNSSEEKKLKGILALVPLVSIYPR